ncbi:MAG: transketolase C-terminal domain-containing protein, partial [Pirellulaceae bacterium]
GLIDVFGKDRIRSFPLGDHVLVGAAIGAALAGLRPIIDLISPHEISGGLAHLVQAASTESLSQGTLVVPITLRLATGYGMGAVRDQAGDLHSLWTSTPGIQVVAPATPYVGKGTLKSAIRSNQLTVLLEDRGLFETRQEIGDDECLLPFGEAECLVEGDLATVVAWGAAVPWALGAAKTLAEKGQRVEVIDLRSLAPIDLKTIGESCVKTGRVFIVEPSLPDCSVGSELIARLQETCFDYLDAPIGRMNVDRSVAYSPTLEANAIPSVDGLFHSLKDWLTE